MTKPRRYTEKDRLLVWDLSSQGFTDKEIAKQMGWTHRSAKRTVQNMRLKMRLKAREERIISDPNEMTLEQMSRDQRFRYLREILEKTPRAKFVFESFAQHEKKLFLDEYFKIIKSTDSLTEAEEQALFSACIEYVLAYRALSLDSEEQKMYQETLRGVHQPGDIRHHTNYNSSFQQQYDKHIATWKDLMKFLKMSREQRLDKIKSDKKSIIDIATELSNRSAQAHAMEEIERLNKETNEELMKLVENGHLFGMFGGKESKK